MGFFFYQNRFQCLHTHIQKLIPRSSKKRTYVVHGNSVVFCQNHWDGIHKAGKCEFIWVLTVNVVTQNLGSSLVPLILKRATRKPANAFEPLKVGLVQILKL